jgi:anti-sigma factor RsiW
MMAMSKKMLEQEPSETELLLPWHAAGTLNARDARRVDEALARDPELARQYAVIRQEYAETIDLNESLGAPSARAMQKLFAAIDAEPARKPAMSQKISAGISAFFASLSPRTLAWSSGVGAVALLLQAGVIGAVLVNNEPAPFQTEPRSARWDRTRPRVRWCGSRRRRASPTSRRCSTAIRLRSSTAPRVACFGCNSATRR